GVRSSPGTRSTVKIPSAARCHMLPTRRPAKFAPGRTGPVPGRAAPRRDHTRPGGRMRRQPGFGDTVEPCTTSRSIRSRAPLRHLLDSGRPRVHEPAYDPDPDHYVTWEYARGYADGVHDTLTENGE